MIHHNEPPKMHDPIGTEIEVKGEAPLTAGGPKTPEEIARIQSHWLTHVYQGDTVPQLTFRAVVMGGFLGSLMAVANLYTMIKIGWSFGVVITSCVLSYVIWNTLRKVFRKLTPMSILENNCMQSTASAAGSSTGATIGVAFGAYLLITGHHIGWQIVLPWTLITAALGVFLAIPMKRQMINVEQLRFPTGIAAAETLRSLYGQSREAILQAYVLVSTLIAGALIGFMSKGNYKWQHALYLKLPELISFKAKIFAIDLAKMPGFGFEPSVLLIGAGMIVGLRVSGSMLLSSVLLYLVVAPQMINLHEIAGPENILQWALWSGTAVMVTSGLTSFALQWKTIIRSFTHFKIGATNGNRLNNVEVPVTWFFAGIIPLTIAMVFLEYVSFSISIPLGIASVILSAVLALVACRATGETDITPIGAMGKITQLSYAFLAPSNITTNLMAASVTANTASSSADLLTDLKSGYLLGANARKQFLAQFIGVFFGTMTIVVAWFLMIPNKNILEAYNPPAANMWRAVAEALAYGIQYVPVSARWGILIGGIIGIVLAVIEHFAPKIRHFIPSPMGLGLAWVMPFSNCFSFFIGAVLAYTWQKTSPTKASMYVIPAASGAIAGESLVSAIIAMIAAAAAIGH
jgi:putative OPT family oligopeptide transporter